METISEVMLSATKPLTEPKKGSLLSRHKDFRRCDVRPDNENAWKRYFLSLVVEEFWEADKEFELNNNNRSQIAFCYNWVLGRVDNQFKGLLLFGKVGTGKTCLLKATMKFANELYFYDQRAAPIWITADKVSKTFEGRIGAENSLNRLYTCKLLFVDDIGYEALKVFDSVPIAELIRERYDNKRMTCFTTNLTLDKIQNRYGESAEDKISQMCYILEFEGESKR